MCSEMSKQTIMMEFTFMGRQEGKPIQRVLEQSSGTAYQVEINPRPLKMIVLKTIISRSVLKLFTRISRKRICQDKIQLCRSATGSPHWNPSRETCKRGLHYRAPL